MSLAKETSHLDVPFHLRNATSSITRDLGHGEGYRYAHNEPNAFAAGESYFPEALGEIELYQPTDRGLEKQLVEKRNYLRMLNEQSNDKRYK